ncbi:S-layer homology domain-containing protein [Paenibacillus sp. GSMTC-2017]|uniref:S-layer homology domain-containing protein n=1 Tax=Paenibacillus sp. GSMTC-2017 TaxID=2794350 RepID=UPI0018D6FE60|nr:S-layer homology domain-containing protein [Paenibacillus sp. GSMTC-2017]MBH5318581.1 S-layer homology domain-containing protein [Paenibacillus sp. GSMTC-2017]
MREFNKSIAMLLIIVLVVASFPLTVSANNVPVMKEGWGDWKQIGSVTDNVYGNVIVSDPTENIVRIFNSDETVSQIIGVPGTSGNSNHELNAPKALAIHPNGNLYVGDYRNNRIQVFQRDEGTGLFGYFETLDLGYIPMSIVIDSDGNLIVADTITNNKIEIYYVDGTTQSLVTNGSLTDLSIDSNGNLYGVDLYGYVVVKFDKLTPTEYSTTEVVVAGVRGTSGSDELHFNMPSQLTIDSNDNIYVLDTGNKRVQVLNSTGGLTATLDLQNIAHWETDIFISKEGMFWLGNNYPAHVGVFAYNPADSLNYAKRLGEKALAPLLSDVAASRGDTDWTTRISGTAAEGNHLAIKVSNSSTATPYIGEYVPEGTINPYLSTDISADSNFNKYVAVYELNENNNIIKFAQIELTDDDVKQPKPFADPLYYQSVNKGSELFTTQISLNPVTDVGNRIVAVVSNQLIDTPYIGDSAPSGANVIDPYEGTDISGVDPVTNKFIALYEVDTKGNVIKFASITLDYDHIKSPYPTDLDFEGLSEFVAPGKVVPPFKVLFVDDDDNIETSRNSFDEKDIVTISVDSEDEENIPLTYTSSLIVNGVATISGLTFPTNWKGETDLDFEAGSGIPDRTLHEDKRIVVGDISLGGDGSPLAINLSDEGDISAYLLQGNGYVRQYYGHDAWGTNLFLTNQLGETKRYTSPFYSNESEGTLALGIGNITKQSDNSIEIVWLLEDGSLQLKQSITYNSGDYFYEKKWSLENVSADHAYSNVKIIHGGDSYFYGEDNARAYWNEQLNMIFLRNEFMDKSGVMSFYGSKSSPADQYYGGKFDDGNKEASEGNLTNRLNHSGEGGEEEEFVDAGYQLQWNRSSLTSGQKWDVISYERWTGAGLTQILAPENQSAPLNKEVTYRFAVLNLFKNDQTVDGTNFDLTAVSEHGWPVEIVGGNSVVIKSGNTTFVDVKTTVPGDTFHKSDKLTFTAKAQIEGSTAATELVTTKVTNPLEPKPDPEPTPEPTTPTSTIEEITVEIETGDAGLGNTISKTKVVRETAANGTQKDKVTLSREASEEAVKKANEQGLDTVRIVIPDAKDNVVEVKVDIPLSALKSLQTGQHHLELFTENMRILVPASSLSSFDKDMYFRIVPIKEEPQKKEVVERAKQEQIVKEMAQGMKINVLGRPMIVETNMENRPVVLYLPLKNVLPSDEKERQEILDNLVIYIEHDDGTKELVTGKLVNYRNGEQGIEFHTNKFSTFTMLYVEGLKERQNKPEDEHKAYIKGYAGQLFKPEKHIDRSEVAAILDRVMDKEATQTAKTYTDLSPSHWAKENIDQVTKMGLMSGYQTETFQPEKAITRGEMATIVSRLIEKQTGDKGAEGSGAVPKQNFSDIDGHWAKEAIEKAHGAGIITGYTDHTFRPDHLLTRAEAVTIINKLLGRGPLSGGSLNQWNDVTESHWALGHIQEASIDHNYEKKVSGGEQLK